ncbi:farnesoic acid 0-methyl transferase domain-containing protein [Phthorimaea operculella]|nr:farnesoic acid 0-methyl transferase domain-containing protein [Phthorimaea operculella]
MGDPMSVTTWPRHQNLFYQVSGSGVSFEVKAPRNALVGLARKPGVKVDYWIGIGDNNRCWIKKDEEHCETVKTQNVINAANYSRFWLQWNAGTVRLGSGHGESGDQKPIVSYPNNIPNLRFVTFGVLHETNPVHWMFDLAPVLPKLQLNKQISRGKLQWVRTTNHVIPEGALIAGFEKYNGTDEVVYVIRGEHRGSLTPGKLLRSGAQISWGGAAHRKNDYTVLCGFDCTWMPTHGDRIPIGAVEGGYSENVHETLYVGRASHEGHLIPGKAQPSHKVCYIPYDGKEIAKKNYEILVEPIKAVCAHDTYFSEMKLYSPPGSDQEEDDASDPDWLGQGDDDDMYGYDENEMNQVMAL